MTATEANGEASSGIQGSGLRPERAHTKTCVLYDGESGKIQHVHSVTTHGDIEPRTDGEVEKEAHALIKQSGRSLTRARALHLSGEFPRDPEVEYAVDLKTLKLRGRQITRGGGGGRKGS